MCINSHLETYLVILCQYRDINDRVMCQFWRKNSLLAIWCFRFWRICQFWHVCHFWQTCPFGDFTKKKRWFSFCTTCHFWQKTQHGDARKRHGSDSCPDGDGESDHAWITAMHFLFQEVTRTPRPHRRSYLTELISYHQVGTARKESSQHFSTLKVSTLS